MIPIAFETMGTMSKALQRFISDFTKRMEANRRDTREREYMKQLLYVAVCTSIDIRRLKRSVNFYQRAYYLKSELRKKSWSFYSLMKVWLKALLSPQLGTMLDPNYFRIVTLLVNV